MPEGRWVARELSYDPSICQFVGRKRAACAKCVEVCPHDALGPAERDEPFITLNAERCDDCGDCVAVCPTGAMAQKIATRQPLATRLKECGGKVVVLCEEAVLAESIELGLADKPLSEGVAAVVVARLAMLSEADFAEAVQISRRGVVVLAPSSATGDGASSGAERPFLLAAEIIGRVSERLFARPILHVVRGASALADLLAQIVSEPECRALPESYPAGITLNSDGRKKRETLSQMLDLWLEASTAAGAAVDSGDPSPIAHPAYAAIVCDDEKCVLCGACAAQCKIGAIRMIRGDEERRLLHSSIACLNCGVCVEVCPADALSSQPGLRLDHDFLAERELAKAEGLACAECGKAFTTRKRSQRVSRQIASVFGGDPIREELLRLCPECRAKKAAFDYPDWTNER
jgi:formate hydrogenlyase subunit 6/NADH:ubiquinone oxidoreductase subunit I